MKMLETKQEIAIAINMHEMPVVRIDLADADEKAAVEAEKKLDASQKGRDEARAWATRAQDALHDFEAQEF